jgi:carbonic anhydrase/acetyltransferase-like protein (isoleucine patch superfamily)
MALRRIRAASLSSLRNRLSEERRTRMLAARAARNLTPPPPSRFGAFGRGSVIGAPSRVSHPELIYIGDDVIIHEHAWISVVPAVEGVQPKLVIHDGTRIDRLIHIACVGEIEIGPQALIGERVLIGDTFHMYEDVTKPVMDQPMAYPRKVSIGWGSHIGLGALIMQGVTVGGQAYVGAGAVVTRDVPPRSVVVGNPARVIRRYDEGLGAWVAPD